MKYLEYFLCPKQTSLKNLVLTKQPPITARAPRIASNLKNKHFNCITRYSKASLNEFYALFFLKIVLLSMTKKGIVVFNLKGKSGLGYFQQKNISEYLNEPNMMAHVGCEGTILRKGEKCGGHWTSPSLDRQAWGGICLSMPQSHNLDTGNIFSKSPPPDFLPFQSFRHFAAARFPHLSSTDTSSSSLWLTTNQTTAPSPPIR